MATPQTRLRRPQPEDYRTAAEYRGARRNWKRSHGGSLLVLLAIAFAFGAWTSSQPAVWTLVVFAVVAWLNARSRP